jgi:hypothetical protein
MDVKFNHSIKLVNNEREVYPHLEKSLPSQDIREEDLDFRFQAWEYAEAVAARVSGKSNGRDDQYIDFFKLI